MKYNINLSDISFVIPNTKIFNGPVELTDRGYVLTNEMMKTNIDGVYSVGDVREKFLL